MRKCYYLFFIILMWGLAACANGESDVTPTPTETAVSPTSTPIPEPTATRTPRPTATPFAPTVVVTDQEISDDGVLVIESDFYDRPRMGCLVLHCQRVANLLPLVQRAFRLAAAKM